jgi:hypothetical protein
MELRAKYDSCLLKYKAILNAIYKLENYAESPTKNVLTTQSCQANISSLLSYLNLSSRKRSCVYQFEFGYVDIEHDQRTLSYLQGYLYI